MAGQAEWLTTLNAVGRSQAVIRCVCGHRNHFYLWSWAGHGKARCTGCKNWIRYTTLDVFKDIEELRQMYGMK